YLPYCGFYRKGKPPAEKDGSYDDLYSDRRKLHSGVSDHSEGKNRIYSLRGCMGGSSGGDHRESLLDHLSKMVFFSNLHRNGMAVCICLCAYRKSLFSCRVRLAAGRRPDLYHRRCDLCPEASDFQLQA